MRAEEQEKGGQGSGPVATLFPDPSHLLPSKSALLGPAIPACVVCPGKAVPGSREAPHLLLSASASSGQDPPNHGDMSSGCGGRCGRLPHPSAGNLDPRSPEGNAKQGPAREARSPSGEMTPGLAAPLPAGLSSSAAAVLAGMDHPVPALQPGLQLAFVTTFSSAGR